MGKKIKFYDDKTFKKNMDILERRYPDLAKQVKATTIGQKYGFEITNVRGVPNIKRLSDGALFYDVNDPIGIVKNELESLDKKMRN